MKKFVSILLALCLCAGLCVTALSDGETVQLDENTSSVTSQVTLTVSIVDDYTIVIPASVTIDPETKTGTGMITLKAGYVLGGEAKKLQVRLASAANGIWNGSGSALYDNNTHLTAFHLENSDGEKCNYEICISDSRAISADGSAQTYYNNDNIKQEFYTWSLEHPLIQANSTEDNTQDKTCTLIYYVPVLPLSGTYTDTLTFSIVTEE